MGSPFSTNENNSSSVKTEECADNNDNQENQNQNQIESNGKTLNIIHFNDVYNITEGNKDICGGAARFMGLISKLKELKPSPLIFFSGDFLSPSNISTVTKGEHMIPVMNKFGITCGMIGNHDLDYGNEHCIECFKQLNYPVLNTNIFTPKDKVKTETESSELAKKPQIKSNAEDDNPNETESGSESPEPAADKPGKAQLAGPVDDDLEAVGKCDHEYIFNHNGFKIAVIGVSEDWCNTITIKPKNGIVYKDFIEECQKNVSRIKTEHSDIDLMIVLTHSRKQNDVLLANKVEGVDLILGGHDHIYAVEMNKINKSLLVKSGCDFKGCSLIQLMPKKDKKENEDQDEVKDENENENERILSGLNEICLNESHLNMEGLNYSYNTFYYNINKKLEPDQGMEELVKEKSQTFLQQISKPIGEIACDLDTRFKMIRRYEAASCNLICDIVRNAYKCDIVILCGGGIRSDKIHEKGIITYADVLDLVPFQDPVVIKKMSGKNVIKAIKHSILNLPKLDGRFAHVSGLKYTYDSRKDPQDRLINVKVNRFNDEERDNYNQFNYVDIEEDKYYSVASREYTMNGGDGFESFKDPENEYIVDDERGVPLSVLLRNFFWAIETVNDAIRLTQDQDQSQDEKFVEDTNKLMTRLGINNQKRGNNAEQKEAKEETEDDDNPSNIGLLTVEPLIEGRIVDIADREKESVNSENNELNVDVNVNVDEQKVITTPNYNKLPSYVNMTHKPKRKQSITAFISNFD